MISDILFEIEDLKMEHKLEPDPNKRYWIKKKIDQLKQKLVDEHQVTYEEIS